MPNDQERLAELRASIALRLRKVCGAMPDDEFDGLVLRIAEIAYKYEQIQDYELSMHLSPRPAPASEQLGERGQQSGGD